MSSNTQTGINAAGHDASRIDRRAESLNQMRALLAIRPMSRSDLCAQLGLASGTVYGT